LTTTPLGEYDRSAVAKRSIHIEAGSVEAVAELNDTQTADSIWELLPIEGIVQTWGDEIYFTIPLSLAQENAQDVVDVGDLGFWAPGKAFCIFFGPTPASRGNEIRPASPVNVFGTITGDATVFKSVEAGTGIIVVKGNNG
jgi:hypothetical protein